MGTDLEPELKSRLDFSWLRHVSCNPQQPPNSHGSSSVALCSGAATMYSCYLEGMLVHPLVSLPGNASTLGAKCNATLKCHECTGGDVLLDDVGHVQDSAWHYPEVARTRGSGVWFRVHLGGHPIHKPQIKAGMFPNNSKENMTIWWHQCGKLQ